jgi:hypothetical protein
MLNDEWCRATLEARETGSEEPIYVHSEAKTKSSIQFTHEGAATVRSLLLLSEATASADRAIHVAKTALDGVHNPDRAPGPRQDVPAGPFTTKLNAVSRVVFEMALVRVVDNMTTYFSEVIRECLLARPELLRSKEVVTFEVALGCESMDELRALLVDRKVDELAYAGFPKLSEWMSDRLGVKGLENLPARGAVLEVLELRNCIVHNRSRVSPKFLRVTGSTEHEVGQRLEVNVDHLYLAGVATGTCVKHVNDQLADKFGIGLSMKNGWSV